MNPTTRTNVFASTTCASSSGFWSQTAGVPAMAEPATLPTTPTANASTIDPTATPRATRPLARMTRPRWGTSVKVVSPLRWLHSLVTDRIATIGRTTAIGKPTAREKVL